MSTLTVADFRSQLAKYFDLVLAGEKVFIRRKNKLFTIVPVDDVEVDISTNQELSEKIDQARWELQNGQCVTLSSHEDVDKLFE